MESLLSTGPTPSSLINHLVNNGGDCRSATATPGLLFKIFKNCLNCSQIVAMRSWIICGFCKRAGGSTGKVFYQRGYPL